MVCVVRESHEQVHQLVAYATHFVANTENSSVNESNPFFGVGREFSAALMPA